MGGIGALFGGGFLIVSKCCQRVAMGDISALFGGALVTRYEELGGQLLIGVHRRSGALSLQQGQLRRWSPAAWRSAACWCSRCWPPSSSWPRTRRQRRSITWDRSTAAAPGAGHRQPGAPRPGATGAGHRQPGAPRPGATGAGHHRAAGRALAAGAGLPPQHGRQLQDPVLAVDGLARRALAQPVRPPRAAGRACAAGAVRSRGRGRQLQHQVLATGARALRAGAAPAAGHHRAVGRACAAGVSPDRWLTSAGAASSAGHRPPRAAC